jgi:hypothetical protein
MVHGAWCGRGGCGGSIYGLAVCLPSLGNIRSTAAMQCSALASEEGCCLKGCGCGVGGSGGWLGSKIRGVPC